MKASVMITMIMAGLILLPLSPIHAKSTAPNDSAIIDIIVEYTPEGPMVQIGNTTVTIPEKIMIDDGSGQLVPTGKESLKLGQLVKASLAGKADSSSQATQLTIFIGNGLENALKELDEESDLRNKLQKVVNNNSSDPGTAEESSAKPKSPTDSGTPPRLVDGVWVN